MIKMLAATGVMALAVAAPCPAQPTATEVMRDGLTLIRQVDFDDAGAAWLTRNRTTLTKQ